MTHMTMNMDDKGCSDEARFDDGRVCPEIEDSAVHVIATVAIPYHAIAECMHHDGITFE
jgi:uncharacterized protein (UPF0248 family)